MHTNSQQNYNECERKSFGLYVYYAHWLRGQLIMTGHLMDGPKQWDGLISPVSVCYVLPIWFRVIVQSPELHRALRQPMTACDAIQPIILLLRCFSFHEIKL
jgi:hypothetical protein